MMFIAEGRIPVLHNAFVIDNNGKEFRGIGTDEGLSSWVAGVKH